MSAEEDCVRTSGTSRRAGALSVMTPQRWRDLKLVLFGHYSRQLRGKVQDYVDPLAIQINLPVVCKHEDQRLWLFRECSRFDPIGHVVVHLRTESFFPIG